MGSIEHEKIEAVPSSYSYICKECFIEGVKVRKKDKLPKSRWEYPDW